MSVDARRHNAAIPLRNPGESVRNGNGAVPLAPDDYGFLISHFPAPNLHLDDLASAAVSKLVDAGLTLWGPENDETQSIDVPWKIEDLPWIMSDKGPQLL